MATPGGVVIKDVLTLTYKPDGSSAYTAGHLVKLSADDTVTPTTAQGEVAIGVVVNDVSATESAAGIPVDVCHMGAVRLIADAAITRMGKLTVGGTTVTRTMIATGSDYVFGKALTAAAGAADEFEAIVDFTGSGEIKA